MEHLINLAFLMAGLGVFFAGLGILMWGINKKDKK